MLVPVLTLSYAMTGLAEAANEASERDSKALLMLHLLILVPFALGGAFVVLCALYLVYMVVSVMQQVSLFPRCLPEGDG